MTEKLPPSAIDSAPMEEGRSPTVQVGSDPFTKDPILEQKMGLIGKVLGDKEHSPTSIAFLCIAAGFLIAATGIVVAMVSDVENAANQHADMLITGGLSLMSGALGYVFGKT